MRTTTMADAQRTYDAQAEPEHDDDWLDDQGAEDQAYGEVMSNPYSVVWWLNEECQGADHAHSYDVRLRDDQVVEADLATTIAVIMASASQDLVRLAVWRLRELAEEGMAQEIRERRDELLDEQDRAILKAQEPSHD